MKRVRRPIPDYRLLQEWEKCRVQSRLHQAEAEVRASVDRLGHLEVSRQLLEAEAGKLDEQLGGTTDRPEQPGLREVRQGYLLGLRMDHDDLQFKAQHLQRTLTSRQGLLSKLRIEWARVERRLQILGQRDAIWGRHVARVRGSREDRELADIRATRQRMSRRETSR